MVLGLLYSRSEGDSMRRFFSPALLLTTAALLFALPYESRDVGELLPVETALLSREEGTVILETDLGLTGRGTTLEEAVAELKTRAPGSLFLDTGNFVLLRPSALDLLPELRTADFLRDSCTLCMAEGELDLSGVGDYLRAHEPDSDLGRAFAALAEGQTPKLPLLRETEGTYRLEGDASCLAEP